jgi:CO/xanthine dehydrogenase FAD-binding subunit
MQSEINMCRPRGLSEALGWMGELSPQAKPLAGGTNIVVELRDGHHSGKTLVDLTHVHELRGIEQQNGHIVIGGGTTITELLAHPLIAEYASPLRESAAVFANPLVRNRATVAGNLADGSPAADTAPPLLALGAELELVSQNGARRVKLEDFLVGVRKTLLRPDELVRSIRWARPSRRSAGAFYKLGLRKADAISVLSVAVMLEYDQAGACSLVRIALGAVAPRPMLAHEAEQLLTGRVPTPELIHEAALLAAEAARPISDIRGSAAYRTRALAVTVRRLLERSADPGRLE